MPRYVDLNNPKIIHTDRDKFGYGVYHIPPDLPTLQLVEPKTGQWIVDEKRFGDAEHHCNLCGAILEGDEWEWRNNYFCYHCGARMKREKECEKQQ